MSCTRSSVRVQPRAPWTPRTLSNRHLAGLDRCAVLWRNTWRIHWPRGSCEGTSSRATRWRCTRLVNNWRSRWLSRSKASGKTVFALQTLVNGARQFGEPGIFVAFEENSRHILANAASFGWNLPKLEKKQLFFFDAKMGPDVIKAGEFDVSGMLAGIKAEADARGARRIVFDAVDALLSLLDDPLAERREIYRLDDWLSESGLTGIITAKSQGDDPFVGEGYGFMQFMADCVVALKLRVVDQIALRYVQVIKYRGSRFAENQAPLVIGASGMETADITVTTVAPEASQARGAKGVERP